MDIPTCPKCSESLVWRDPTDTLQDHMFVRCACTDIDFWRPELASTSIGPEVSAYTHHTMDSTKQDGRDLRKDIVEYWGEDALRWIEERAGIARPS